MSQHQIALAGLLGFTASVLIFSAPLLYRVLSKPLKKQRTLKCLGFEMGGTTCKVGVGEKTLDGEGKVISCKIISTFTVNTYKSPEDTVDALLNCIMNAYYEDVGIAHFGPLALDPEKANYGCVTTTPKEGWQDFHSLEVIRSKLAIKTKKVSIDTDVNAAAMAEFFLGGHKVKRSLAYITIGTGVGVGLVIDGKPVHGLIHPEGGHTTIIKHEKDKDFDGVCPYHGNNCIEGMTNNISIAKRKGIERSEVEKLSDDDEIWEIIGHYIGILCANIIFIASPEVIVIGGGIIKRKAIYPYILKSFSARLNSYLSHPKIENVEEYIKVSALSEAGLLGAMVL